MGISNKTLAVLLIAAMVVSVGGAMMNLAKLTEIAQLVPLAKGITGFGVTGIVNVSLQATANLNVSQTFCDFGVGIVTPTKAGAELISCGANQSNWTNYGGYAPSPLAIENIGNVNLSVSVSSDKNNATFFGGGTLPQFQFNASNKDAGSCTGTIQGAFMDVEIAAAQAGRRNVCNQLRFETGNNELYVCTRLYIPSNTLTGNKTAIWTFNISQV